MSSDRRQEDRVPTSIRVRLQYPDVDTFVERYATNVSRGGIFIQSQRTQPTGTLIRFEFQLQDKSAAIRGEGRVAWAVPFDPTHPERTYGMGVRFTRLDVKSKKIIDEMVSARVARGERDPGLQPPSPEAARTEEALREATLAKPPEPAVEPDETAVAEPPPQPEPEPRAAKPAPEPARPAPKAPPPPPPAPKPGDSGRPDPSPVREIDFGAMGDVTVDVRALLQKTLGRQRLEATDADALLDELSKGVVPARSGPRASSSAAAAKPEPRREPKPAPAPKPKEKEPERAQPAEVQAAAAAEPLDDTARDSGVQRVIRDLFEDSHVGELPIPDEESPPLPELLEVPVPADAPKTPAPAAKDDAEELSSLFDEDDGAGAATPPPAPPAADAGGASFEGDIPEGDAPRTSFPEVSSDVLTALDEPLEDDFGARPSLAPSAVAADVDLDAPLEDDFSPAEERTEVESLLAEIALEEAGSPTPPPPPPIPGAAPEAELEIEDGLAPVLSDDDPKPKKGFFKKLFGK